MPLLRVQRVVHDSVLTSGQIRGLVETHTRKRAAVVVRDRLAVEVQRAGLIALKCGFGTHRIDGECVAGVPDVRVAGIEEVYLTAPCHPLRDAGDQDVLAVALDGNRNVSLEMLHRAQNRGVVVVPRNLPVSAPGHGRAVVLVVVAPERCRTAHLDGDPSSSIDDEVKRLLAREIRAVRGVRSRSAGSAAATSSAAAVLASAEARASRVADLVPVGSGAATAGDGSSGDADLAARVVHGRVVVVAVVRSHGVAVRRGERRELDTLASLRTMTVMVVVREEGVVLRTILVDLPVAVVVDFVAADLVCTRFDISVAVVAVAAVRDIAVRLVLVLRALLRITEAVAVRIAAEHAGLNARAGSVALFVGVAGLLTPHAGRALASSQAARVADLRRTARAAVAAAVGDAAVAAGSARAANASRSSCAR